VQKKLKISAIQTDIVWENIEKNLQNIEKKILNAEDSDIFILPEMFTTGFTNNIAIINNNNCKKTIETIQNLSNKKNSAICGSIIYKEENLFFNRFIFVSPDGNIKFYNKKHLFELGGETNIFTKGNERLIIDYKGFKILPIICYDLRFPVWIRNKNEYDLIIVVANWPQKRQKIWKILLQARAIENQCFVVGVNRIDSDKNNIKYNGGTAIINYIGNIINSTKYNENQIITEILDKEELDSFKKNMPFLNDIDNFEIKPEN